MGARKREAIKAGKTVQSARYDYIYMEQPAIQRTLAVAGSEKNAVTLSIKRHGAVTRSSLQRLFDETEDLDFGHALGFYYDKIAANEDGGEQLTYDLSVPENVTYIANGFVS